MGIEIALLLYMYRSWAIEFYCAPFEESIAYRLSVVPCRHVAAVCGGGGRALPADGRRGHPTGGVPGPLGLSVRRGHQEAAPPPQEESAARQDGPQRQEDDRAAPQENGTSNPRLSFVKMPAKAASN